VSFVLNGQVSKKYCTVKIKIFVKCMVRYLQGVSHEMEMGPIRYKKKDLEKLELRGCVLILTKAWAQSCLQVKRLSSMFCLRIWLKSSGRVGIKVPRSSARWGTTCLRLKCIKRYSGVYCLVFAKSGEHLQYSPPSRSAGNNCSALFGLVLNERWAKYLFPALRWAGIIYPRLGKERGTIIPRSSAWFQRNSKGEIKPLKQVKRLYLRAHLSSELSSNFSISFFWYQIWPISITWDAPFKIYRY